MQALPATRRVCFGPFHLDFVRGELRKHGVRIRLSRQPFQVLETLIQAQGEVVTRDELRAKLWPQDQFGDFDHSLNVAVKKLRDCLGDSAAEPRYIATVERQGYRFVGVLAVGEDANRQPVAQATGKVEGLSLRSAVTAQQKSRKKMMAGIAIAAVVLAAIGSWRLVQSRPAPHVIRYTQLTHSGVVHPNQKLLTDGPRLYFIERDFAEHKSGAWVGKWMLTSGGPATSLNLPFE